MNSLVEIDPDWKWDDNLSMSQGIRIGNFLYLSGQISLDADGVLVGRGSMTEQSKRVFQNIETILDRAGARPEHIFKISAFLTDMSRYSEYSAERTRFFMGRKPASTTVQVSALAFEGLLVEVEAVAYIE